MSLSTIKYSDKPRFPKIQSIGYELDLRNLYHKTLDNMLKEMSKKIIQNKTK